MLNLKKLWPFCGNTGKSSEPSFGPYRNKAKIPKGKKVKPKSDLLFEEKVLKLRKALPGPVRRLLAIILFVPIIALAFLFAIVSVPFAWIASGNAAWIWDRSYYDAGHYTCNRRWQYIPLLRGTTALFWDKEDFYSGIREERVRRNY